MTVGRKSDRHGSIVAFPSPAKRGAGPFYRQRMTGRRIGDFACDDGMISPPGCDFGRGQRPAFRHSTGAEDGRLYQRTGELGSVQS